MSVATYDESNRKVYAIVLGILVLSSVCGFWAGREHLTVDQNGGLAIADENLDFGEVWAQDKFLWTLPLENNSGHDVRISEVYSPGCNCLTATLDSEVIAPGKKSDIHLTLDLTSRYPMQQTQATWPFAVDVVAVVDGTTPLHRANWQCAGLVKNAFLVSPPTITFGETLVRGYDFQPQSAVVRCLTPLQSLTAECGEQSATVEVSKHATLPNAFHLAVTPSQSLSLGTFRFTVMLRGVSSEGKPLPGTPLQVEGIVVEDIQANPPRLILGASEAGKTVSETLVLQSRLGRKFTVQGWSAVSDRTVIEPLPGIENGFQLRHLVSQTGAAIDGVEFAVIGEHGKVTTVSVDITSYGQSPNHAVGLPLKR